MDASKFILFVDDEENVLNSLYRSQYKWLAENNLKILRASNAHDTVRILGEKGKDIAVLVADQKMPHLRGSELSRVVAKKYPDTALIILSGHSDMEDMKDIVKSGAVAFMTKPWETEDLQMEIRRALTIYHLRRENRLNRIKEAEELRLGAEFQKSILNSPLPESDRISFNITYKPLSKTGVGGDYYDIIKLDESRYIVLTGDVSGHGLKTSFLAAVLKSIIFPDYIHNLENGTFSPSDFTGWLNQRVCDYLKDFPELFIAFSTALIDLSGNVLTLANAGQPPAYLLRNSEVIKLEQNQLVLGIESGFSYSEINVSLESGDRLIMFSDGIYPSGNESETYVESSFTDILKKNASRLHDHTRLLKDIRKAVGSGGIDDDITLVTTEITED